MKSDKKLRECPFCGGVPEYRYDNLACAGETHAITCYNCTLWIYSFTKQNAFKIWNERITDPRPAFFHKPEGGNPLDPDSNICDTAPYPQCNGANGCDTCEHEPVDQYQADPNIT